MKPIRKLGHDLKQPLTTLRTFCSHIDAKKDDPEFMKEFLKYVPLALDRIEEIADGLLEDKEWQPKKFPY